MIPERTPSAPLPLVLLLLILSVSAASPAQPVGRKPAAVPEPAPEAGAGPRRDAMLRLIAGTRPERQAAEGAKGRRANRRAAGFDLVRAGNARRRAVMRLRTKGVRL